MQQAPFDTSYFISPKLTTYYQFLADSLVSYITHRRSENAPRSYIYELFSRDNFNNEQFFALFRQTVRLVAYRHFVLRQPNIDEVVNNAPMNATDLIMASLIMTDPNMHKVYRPDSSTADQLNNSYQALLTMEGVMADWIKQVEQIPLGTQTMYYTNQGNVYANQGYQQPQPQQNVYPQQAFPQTQQQHYPQQQGYNPLHPSNRPTMNPPQMANQGFQANQYQHHQPQPQSMVFPNPQSGQIPNVDPNSIHPNQTVTVDGIGIMTWGQYVGLVRDVQIRIKQQQQQQQQQAYQNQYQNNRGYGVGTPPPNVQNKLRNYSNQIETNYDTDAPADYDPDEMDRLAADGNLIFVDGGYEEIGSSSSKREKVAPNKPLPKRTTSVLESWEPESYTEFTPDNAPRSVVGQNPTTQYYQQYQEEPTSPHPDIRQTVEVPKDGSLVETYKVDGVEYYKGKVIRQSFKYPEIFYVDWATFEGNPFFNLTRDELYTGIPLVPVGYRRVFKINRNTGRVEAILATMDDNERDMDIRLLEPLIADEEDRETYERITKKKLDIIIESNEEPLEVNNNIPKEEEVVKEGKKEKIKIEFNHAIFKDNENIALENKHLANIRKLLRENKLPTVTTQTGKVFNQIPLDSNVEYSKVENALRNLSNQTNIKEFANYLIKYKTNHPELKDIVDVISKRFDDNVLKVFNGQLGLKLEFKDVYSKLDALLDGIKTNFGVFILNRFESYQNDIIKSSVSLAPFNIKENYFKTLDLTTKPIVNNPKDYILLSEDVSYTTINITENELGIHFDNLNSHIDAGKFEALHILAKKVFKLNPKGRNYLYTSDGTKFEMFESGFSTPDTKNYFMQKVV